MIRVRLYGSARQLVGKSEVELQLGAGARIADVVREVAGPTAELPAGIVSAILINGRNCAFREGLATPVAEGDLIEVLPIVTGG